MNIRLALTVTCCLFFCHAFPQRGAVLSPKDFKNLTGCWKGSLTYLDYTSNKPFTMPAEMTVKDFGDSRRIVCALVYPEEPRANAPDTIFIAENGKALNDAQVTSKKKYGADSLQVITETAGIDGNDNKPALIRHIYTLGKNTYSVKKQVRFNGQNEWIMRNEYKYTRSKPCP